MKNAKIILASTLMLLTCALAGATSPSMGVFPNESLNYKVMYKWGLVNKQAGTASLNIRTDGDHYNAWLTAKSASWADHFYKVRDTLMAKIQREGLKPLVYQKYSHEGKEDKRDEVRYTYNADGTVTGHCTRKKWEKGQLKADQALRLDARGTVVDMLTAFYYMRSLDYGSMKDGQTKVITIFSGKRKETLTIKYHGNERVSYDDQNYSCYHITFTFSEEGKKDTSDPMDAWISRGRARIPIKLEGQLPVGKVQCFFTGASKVES